MRTAQSSPSLIIIALNRLRRRDPPKRMIGAALTTEVKQFYRNQRGQAVRFHEEEFRSMDGSRRRLGN